MERHGPDARERLWAVAREGFFHDGYAALGVAELCARADVRKGSFYHWYASKEALAIDVAVRSWDSLRQRLVDEVFVPDGRPVLSSFESYVDILRASLRSRGDAVLGCRYGNLALELSIGHPDMRRALVGIFTDLTEIFETTIADAQARGEVASDLDAARVARLVCAQMEGLMLLAKAYQDPTVVDDLVPAVAALVGRS